MEDARFSFFKYITVENNSTITAFIGHLSTWSLHEQNLHLRHRGKIKAIYTDNIMDQKEQYSTDWCSN